MKKINYVIIIFLLLLCNYPFNGFVEKQKMEISKDTLKEQDSNSYQSTSSGYYRTRRKV
jgi:hypothetical protein